MKVVADLCVVPLGVGVSVGSYVAECVKILQNAGLNIQLHGYGTNIEGEWEAVMRAIKECHEKLHAMGVPRISSSLRFGTRIDREQGIEDKIQSVKKRMRSK